MTYDSKDWRAVEKALRSLEGKKLGSHKIVEVSVDTLRPTASSISKHTHERPGGRAGKRARVGLGVDRRRGGMVETDTPHWH